MKKQVFSIVITLAILLSSFAFGQIGINTPNPYTTLDVTAKKGVTDTDGLQAPRLTRAELTDKGNTLYGINQEGALVYINDISGGDTAGPRINITTKGYYYFDGAVWKSLCCCSQGTGTITTLDCAGVVNNGTLTEGVNTPAGVTSVYSYTGGNGGTHNGQTVTSTGVTGLTATLPAGNFANGNGTLTYTITGTPSGSGTASFAINIGGQTCTLTRTVDPGAGTITTLDCAGVVNNGTLTEGVNTPAGVTSVYSYTGGNGGTHNGQTVTSTGVTGLTATLPAGNFANGSGTLTYTITGTPSGNGTASFAINIGGQTCTLTRTVNAGTPQFTIASCGTPTGYLANGLPANSTDIAATQSIQVNVTVPGPYSFTASANGVTFSASGTFTTTGTQTINLIGSGTPTSYTVDNNTIAYTVSNTTGTNAGSCSFARKVYVPDQNYTGTIRNDGAHRFLYKVITFNGKEWLQTNLGAHYNQVGHPNFNPEMAATGVDDYLAFGSLFQLGRNSDGHELVTWTSATSPTGLSTVSTTIPAYNDVANTGLFYASTNTTDDHGSRIIVNGRFIIGPGMPCPSGFMVASADAANPPDYDDYPASSYNAGSSFWISSGLKLVAPQVYRDAANGSIVSYGRRLIRENSPQYTPFNVNTSPQFVIEGGALTLPGGGRLDRRVSETYNASTGFYDERGPLDAYPIRCVKP